MTEFNVYIWGNTALKMLPKLIESVYEAEYNVQVLCCRNSIITVKELDSLLWSYSSTSFLPHCTDNDRAIASDTPIFITEELEANLNKARVLICLGAVSLNDLLRAIHSKCLQDIYDKVLFICNEESQYQPHDIAICARKMSFSVHIISKDPNGFWQKEAL